MAIEVREVALALTDVAVSLPVSSAVYTSRVGIGASIDKILLWVIGDWTATETYPMFVVEIGGEITGEENLQMLPTMHTSGVVEIGGTKYLVVVKNWS